MKRKNAPISMLICTLMVLACSSKEDFKVLREVTGGIETNCYLLYSKESKEAALINVGGPIITLLDFIEENDLEVKYFLFTHGHPDHIIGLPDIRGMFPEARVCIHKLDYDDIFTSKQWAIDNLGQGFIDYLLSDPERKKIYDFDPESFGKPDIFIEDGQTFALGRSVVKAVHSPGHSPGSVCFYIDGMLFSGDVLFYRTVGRVDVQNSSKADQIISVMKLYERFLDETKVYPGHGEFTDIGSEKKENAKININEVTL